MNVKFIAFENMFILFSYSIQQAIELTTGADLQQAKRDARSTQITALAMLEHNCMS